MTNWLGNTKIVERTKTLELIAFPELKQRKAGRVVTKHFANLTYCMEQKHLSFLSFLIYQASADNTIQYTSKIHEMYDKAIELARIRFGQEGKRLASSHPKVRNMVIYLIERGLLLPTTEKAKYMINPNLTYNRTFISKAYFDSVLEKYNEIRKSYSAVQLNDKILEFTTEYTDHVSSELKKHHRTAQFEQ